MYHKYQLGRKPTKSCFGWLQSRWTVVRADRKIMLLGAVQSLFEASMYTFVFLWTPALSPNGEKVAHGMIFACFMMSCMAGSTIAGRLLSDSRRYSVSHYMKVDLTSVVHGVPRSQLCEGGPAHAASTL